MNICMPGMCICDAAEYEGDRNCNSYYGLPEPWDVEREREQEEYRAPRSRWVFNETIEPESLPRFDKKIIPGGVQATEKQRSYIDRLLNSKFMPMESLVYITARLDIVSRRSAPDVINYLQSMPYKTHKVYEGSTEYNRGRGSYVYNDYDYDSYDRQDFF